MRCQSSAVNAMLKQCGKCAASERNGRAQKTGDVCHASGVMNPNIKRVSMAERQVMDGVNYQEYGFAPKIKR